MVYNMCIPVTPAPYLENYPVAVLDLGINTKTYNAVLSALQS